MIVSIFTSLETGAPMEGCQVVEAVAGKGLEGDRYATGKGFYTGVAEWDAHVTLIEEEPFLSLAAQHGMEIDPKALRRNFVTRGTDFEIADRTRIPHWRAGGTPGAQGMAAVFPHREAFGEWKFSNTWPDKRASERMSWREARSGWETRFVCRHIEIWRKYGLNALGWACGWKRVLEVEGDQ